MTTNPTDTDSTGTTTDGSITVFHRPGCPYCYALRRGLRRAGVTFDEIDIWDDPAAAATVRSIANGNETVPTVIVNDVARVNPSAREVVELACEHALDAVPPDVDLSRRHTRRRVFRRR